MNAFQPPFWLRNPHIQSLLASSPMRKALMRKRAHRFLQASQSLLLDGGNGVHLLGYWTPQSQPAPLVILLHGWEGTAQSGYLLSAAHCLFEQGYQILRLNLRDHDHSHHLNRELFHSCRLDEVVNAVEHAMQRIQASHYLLGGFSLGGNFTIRVTHQMSLRNAPLTASVAICPLLIAADTMQKLEQGPHIYHAYFARKWKRSIQKKTQLFPQDFADLNLNKHKTLRQLTEYFVHSHTEYPSSEAYFEGYSIRPHKLSGLTIPIYILMSLDDPIIEPKWLKSLEILPSIHITRTHFGGHCGFIKNRHFDCWADEFMNECFDKAINASLF